MTLYLNKQRLSLLLGVVMLLITTIVVHDRSFNWLSEPNPVTIAEVTDQTTFEEETAFLEALSRQESFLMVPITTPTLLPQKNQPQLHKSTVKRQKSVRDNFKSYVAKLSKKYKILSQFIANDLPVYKRAGTDSLSELQCMALNLYFEARGESRAGQQAVAHVVLNRANHAGFPKSVCDVVKQGGENKRYHCQFTWWCDGLSDKPRNKRSWRQSVILSAQVLLHKTKDPTNGALWYHADYAKPYWQRSMEKGPKIGRHIFYSSKKSGSGYRTS